MDFASNRTLLHFIVVVSISLYIVVSTTLRVNNTKFGARKFWNWNLRHNVTFNYLIQL
nr:MAG TPA: hypothetical protein [Caudoviricetes sp.]